MKSKSKILFLCIVSLILFAVFLVFIWMSQGKRSSIERFEGEPIQLQKLQKKSQRLTLGFIPQGNSLLMVQKWKPLADYLEKEIGLPTDLVFRTSYKEIIQALSHGDIDICLTGAYVYVLTKSMADIQPIVRRQKKGSPFYYSLIVTRRNSGVNNVKQLKGKSFAFIDKHSTSGYLLPALMMKKNGIQKPETYFSRIIYTHNHDSAVVAVQKKQIDAAVISSTRWTMDTPLPDELTIIWKSKPILLGPFSVRSKLDQKLIDKITRAFLKIGKTPETMELSEHIQVEGFEKAFDKDYDTLRELIDDFSKN